MVWVFQDALDVLDAESPADQVSKTCHQVSKLLCHAHSTAHYPTQDEALQALSSCWEMHEELAA